MFGMFSEPKQYTVLHTVNDTDSKVLGVTIDHWFGVKRATYTNFSNVLELENVSRGDYIEQILPVLENYTTIVFNGMTELFSAIIDKLQGKRIFVMYHGSPTLHSDNEYENFMFKLILQKSVENKIEGIIFVKEGLEKIFARLGHKAFHLPNKIGELLDKEVSTPSIFKVGALSQHLLWNKNLYNQILAGLSVKDTEVFVNVDKIKLGYLAEEPRIKSVGVIADPKEFQNFLATLDINLNVTLTEAYPMNIIESLQVGIPCLTSRTNHIYDRNTVLSNYLIVDEFDNPQAITAKLHDIMNNYDEIVTEILKFRTTLKAENQQKWDEFLATLN